MLALLTLVLAPAASAVAEPTLSIVKPTNGSTTIETTPEFEGSANATLSTVTLDIYEGTSASGTPVQVLPDLSPGETWTLDPAALPEGTYTALASELNEEAELTFSAPVTFTIEWKPSITSSPGGQTVLAGEAASFTASASGTPAPEVQWQVSTDSGSSWSNDSVDPGNNTDTLTILSAPAGQNGDEYRAVFKNAAGEATSAAARLEVQSGPVISEDPVDKTVKAGETAVFKASASGFPTPEVHWQVSNNSGASWAQDTTDAGNSTDTLSVVSKASENGYEYRALFKNVAGEATSTAATLEVHTPPVVTENPSGEVVKAGEAAVFTAAASGNPVPGVQWEVSTNSGASWSADTTDAGNTSDTLTIFSTIAAQNGYEYRAAFKSSAGSATSAAARLEVQSGPVISEDPVDKTVKAGETAVFKASASGFPTPEVHWQVSNNSGASWTEDTTDAGNSTDTLSVVSKASENGYEYRALFKNAAGEATSSAAHLTVQTAPAVTEGPANEVVKVGEAAVFKASASGFPAPAVQWQLSTNGGSSWANDTLDSGSTTDTLTVLTVAAENGYEYRAFFKNDVGEATSAAAHLEVRTPPAVTANPTNRSVVAGEQATFTVAVSGVPTPTVQWQVSTGPGEPWSDDVTDTGNNTTKLTVVSTPLAKNGYEYRALVENPLGKAESSEATLIVSEKKVAPVVTSNPSSRTVTAGETAVFTAAASGVPTPAVQWEVLKGAGAEWTKDTTDPGRTTGTLVIEPATFAENGYEYRAVFTNSAGTSTSAPALLTVNTLPVIVTSPVSTTVKAGETAVFTAGASGSPPPQTQWQESSDGGLTWEDIPAATSDTLDLAGALASMNGREYRATFTNAAGSVSSAGATLTVNSAPAVTLDPVSQTVTAGEAATFTASASGTPAPEVLWQESVDGGSTWAAVPGAVSGTLTLAGVGLSDSGREYRAVFTNRLGTAVTGAATLTVSASAAPSAPGGLSAPAGASPSASFSWFPASPRVGETVSLASTSTDAASPLTAFAWDPAGSGAFAPGGSVMTTSFATPGGHAVGLRVTDAEGRSSVVSETIVVAKPALTLISPFPIVRIAGTDTASGARVSLLSVQAPLGAQITVTCRGRGCPKKPETRLASSSTGKAGVVLVVFRRFERLLHPGVMLQVRVSKPGEIGKYTSFTIRRSKLPVRVDMCLATTGIPMPCPTS